MKDNVDGKSLHQHLTDLAAEFAKGKIKARDTDARIKSSLEKFIGRGQTVAQNQ